MSIWYVWTEWGEYTQFSRDLRGTFASEALAEAHAAQLRNQGAYDVVEVVEDVVLDEVPVSVPYVRYAAHIRPDGTEDKGLGYHRGSDYSTWSNELGPMACSRVGPWGREGDPNRHIEVTGSDESLVAAEYERLLAELFESPLPGARYAYEVVKRRLLKETPGPQLQSEGEGRPTPDSGPDRSSGPIVTPSFDAADRMGRA